MFELTPQKKDVIEAEGNLLILGGPGSGKTTVALFKAKQIIECGGLVSGQRVLFLSFARATVSRIKEQAVKFSGRQSKNFLEINTYHGFTWNIINSHSYLLYPITPLRLLPPPEASARLAGVESKRIEEEKHRLLREEGLLHFDLFAGCCNELLRRSNKLLKIVTSVYPTIILDEFQDTNSDEWELIRTLGTESRLIALADPEQRIYDFRGANPARIGEFITEFKPTEFDFGIENNRSNDTDILQFGNDLLTGANKGKRYKDVKCFSYKLLAGTGKHIALKSHVLKARQRLIDSKVTDWSIAILVPSNRLMLEVSDYLSNKQVRNNNQFPSIEHDVALDLSGASLAATIISRLLEYGSTKHNNSHQVLLDLCDHIRGRRGDGTVPKTHLNFTDALLAYIGSGKIDRRAKNRELAISECEKLIQDSWGIEYTGDPVKDWIKIRQLLLNSSSEYIVQAGNDAKYLRILRKGGILKSSLSTLWQEKGSYIGATNAVRNALLQEHFALSTKRWTGIHVMTIHKAKGKEFNEVIIYEGLHYGRILRPNATQRQVDQSRLNLRVAVTRAMQQVTILTPSVDICQLLV